jgi:hypothetical protein
MDTLHHTAQNRNSYYAADVLNITAERYQLEKSTNKRAFSWLVMQRKTKYSSEVAFRGERVESLIELEH